MKRRSFLGLVAAGAALPLFNIGCASGPRRIAAGRKIRVALIGCGLRMRSVLSTKCEDVELVALVDPDSRALADIRTRICRRYPGRHRRGDHRHEPAAACLAGAPRHAARHPRVRGEADRLLDRGGRPPPRIREEVRSRLAVRPPRALLADHGDGGGVHPERRDRADSGRVVLRRPDLPEGLNWDLWVGPAAMRPYKTCYGPHQWYDWKGFGNGNIGNMGNHIMDASFFALRLNEVDPLSAELFDQREGAPGSWPLRQTIDFRFPARKGLDPVTIHWWDGIKDGIPVDTKHQNKIGIALKREYQNLPPIVEELEKKYNVPLGQIGTLWMGEKGILWLNEFGSAMQFVPSTLRKDVKKPDPWIPRVKGSHVHEFFAAIREGRRANADFRYGVPLVKTVLLGNVLAQTGLGKLEWNGKRVTNNEGANSYVKTTYRKGWELPSV